MRTDTEITRYPLPRGVFSVLFGGWRSWIVRGYCYASLFCCVVVVVRKFLFSPIFDPLHSRACFDCARPHSEDSIWKVPGKSKYARHIGQPTLPTKVYRCSLSSLVPLQRSSNGRQDSLYPSPTLNSRSLIYSHLIQVGLLIQRWWKRYQQYKTFIRDAHPVSGFFFTPFCLEANSP